MVVYLLGDRILGLAANFFYAVTSEQTEMAAVSPS
jgi:hypothetical protein